MPLRTDYTNDILDTSKNTERKYNIKNSNGTIVEENVTFEDVTEYEQEGSRFGASDINATNTEVNRLNQNLTTQDGEVFRYAKQDGVRGILVNEGGADTFYPFKSFPTITRFGVMKNASSDAFAYIDFDVTNFKSLTVGKLINHALSTSQYIKFVTNDSGSAVEILKITNNGSLPYTLNISQYKQLTMIMNRTQAGTQSYITQLEFEHN